MRFPSRMALAIVASLAAHVGAYGLLDAPTDFGRETEPIEFELHASPGDALSTAEDESAVEPPRVVVTPPPLGARPAPDNIAQRRSGRGGDGAGPVSVVFLAAYTDSITLQDSLPNAYLRSQISRVRVTRHQTSPERRRATPNPHDQPYVATGAGELRERGREGWTCDVLSSPASLMLRTHLPSGAWPLIRTACRAMLGESPTATP